MSNKCSRAICFPKNMSLELGKKIIKKKTFYNFTWTSLFNFCFQKKGYETR